MTTKDMTVKEWLTGLATSNTSDEYDERMMGKLIRQYGFPKAVITCGIVYLEGKGTIDAPPMSIHSLAKMILTKAS